MVRHLVLALTAAMLVATMLTPGDALAHHGRHWHRVAWYAYGWGSDPRAAQPGYPGGHYGSECYRAANGRWMCRFY